MNKDTMSNRAAFINVVRYWHPTYFAGVFTLFLIFAVNVDPYSPLLVWIQAKLPILTPTVFTLFMSLGAFTIGTLRPSPRAVAISTLPAMVLGAATLWYNFTHDTSWVEAVLIVIAFFAVLGVMFLSAAWMQSLETIANLAQENAALRQQVGVEGRPDDPSA